MSHQVEPMPPMNSQTQLIQRASVVSLASYIFLAIAKLFGGFIFHSGSMTADGLNNLSDIFSSAAIFIGLRIAQRPPDDNHHFGHRKYEAIASYTVSLIMFSIGFDIIRSSVVSLWQGDHSYIDPRELWISGISLLILYLAYRYLRKVVKITASLGLKASTQDMRNDLLLTSGSIIGVICSRLGYPMIDTFIALALGGMVVFSAYEILKESTFMLSDGFDENLLQQYETAILENPIVERIPYIRARMAGQRIFVDVVIEVDYDLTVLESHRQTELIEQDLKWRFQIADIDVHVEPFYELDEI